ncbi:MULTISPECIES: hypothetical protein [unclassified Roseibium]|uniref:hypothetical protein n=1 Tax=unclassified Roseibium TaxID=2629323 RepID=UPI00273D3DBF|nr:MULTISPECIES: hypothetical protein [unclassified Roseibium]
MSTNKTIVCAGVPRSGTTLMYRALAGLTAGSTTPDIVTDVEKTHSFQPKNYSFAQKAIFLFSDPVLSVISTKLHRYDPKHFQNCGSGHLDPADTDIFTNDALNYEAMFDSWTNNNEVETICVRYETLYRNIPIIQSFFSPRTLFIPPYKKRSTSTADIDEIHLTQIKSTYSKLIEKTQLAPDVSIRNKY